MNIGERIREVREDYDLTIKEFAEALSSRGVKVDRGNVSRYENDIVKPSYDFFYAIHEVCDVNLNWLITGKGAKYLKAVSPSKRKSA